MQQVENPWVELPYADEPRFLCACKGCDRGVYEDEEQVELNGVILHDDAICISNWAKEELA